MKNNLIIYFILLCQSVSLIAMDSAIKTHDAHEITSSSALQCALPSIAYLEQARLLQRRLSTLSDKALVTVISNQCIIRFGELIIIPDIKTGELIITDKKSVAISPRSQGPFCIHMNKPTPSVRKVQAQCGFTPPPPPPFGKTKKAAAPRAESTSASKAILKKSAGPRPLMNNFQTELTKRLAEKIDSVVEKTYK